MLDKSKKTNLKMKKSSSLDRLILFLILAAQILADNRNNKVPFTSCPTGCTNCFYNKSTSKANCISCFKRMG
jgi:predicted RNA-binding Zn ribbon-like protein